MIATVIGMVLRIDKTDETEFVIFTVSGRLEKDRLVELRQLLISRPINRKIAFDLNNVDLVDQQSVEFLADCESHGIQLWNCSIFLREWITRLPKKQDNECAPFSFKKKDSGA